MFIPLPMRVNWSFSEYADASTLPLKRRPRSSLRGSSFPLSARVVPPLNPAFPNHPFSYSFFKPTSRTFSLLPSSKPVLRVFSLWRSITLTLSTIEAGRLLSAVLWSLKKNVRPPTVNLSMASPLNLTFPSSVISIPGMRISRSLSMALVPTWNEEALNSTVSCFTIIGLPTSVTTAALR